MNVETLPLLAQAPAHWLIFLSRSPTVNCHLTPALLACWIGVA
jgi:hypothetical protein